MYIIADLKKSTRRIAAILCIVFAAALLANPKLAADGIKAGLLICYSSLIPSLFPFLFLVDYLFSLICAARNRKKWVGVMAAVIFGLCGGFPMGAKALSDLVKRREISANGASALLSGCVNAGPAYLISVVGAGLFRNVRAGLLLFAALSMASVVCGAISLAVSARTEGINKTKIIPADSPPQENPGFQSSIRNALNATLSFCAYVTLFSCIGAYLGAVLYRLSASPLISWLFIAFLEVSNGCAAAAGIGSVSGLLLAGAAVSLCGTSVLLQVRSLTASSGISLKYLLVSRPLHMALTLGFLYVFIPLFSSVTDVYAESIYYRIYSFSPIFSIFFILLALIFLLGDRENIVFTNRRK